MYAVHISRHLRKKVGIVWLMNIPTNHLGPPKVKKSTDAQPLAGEKEKLSSMKHHETS